MKFHLPFIILTLLLCGCHRPAEQANSSFTNSSSFTKYATRFDVQKEENYTLLKVNNPWQNSRGLSYTYVLGEDENLLPDSLSVFPFICTPVKRVIAMSTTHVAMIGSLGELGTIVGASGLNYIYNPEIRERCDSGLISEVGYGQALNYEMLVDLQADVVFLYGVEGNVATTARKLEELGIQAVFCAEYLEPDPLGKAEWIRFFSHFYGLEMEADRFFDSVDYSYRILKELCLEVEEKPEVMSGLPWKDSWYVPGGKSFAARLIADAGGNYMWRDNPSSEALPLDLESVFSRAVSADIWINPGVASSIDELIAFDGRFGELAVLKNGDIYNNNARLSEGGGNDYWESATVRPDLILADLILAFHPELLRDHSMFYYKKLK